MLTKHKNYFDFIQYALGIREELPSGVSDMDWKAFYDFSKKQALQGVVFDGIQKLPKELAPDGDLLLEWYGRSLAISKRNRVMYRASSEVYDTIRKLGCRCCILKGQGNAVSYPNPYSRTAGDVDVWVLASREKIREIAMRLADSPGDIAPEIVQHVELTRKGVSIELHPTPSMVSNPFINHRMQKCFKRNADLQCSNIVELPDGMGEMAIPTSAFNVIYQLSHLYHHFFFEGVGLRQIIDYYFVLVKSEELKIGGQKESHRKVKKHRSTDEVKVNSNALWFDLKCLGFWKFAGAVMYVLYEVLGLSEAQMIAPMDELRGKMLLDEILQGGNFGQYDTRHRFGKGALGHNLQRLCRDARLAWYYPSEALSEPIFRLWHFFWRMKNTLR